MTGKKILFFSYGDASSPSTWSNVPFLLSESLKARGWNVIRIALAPGKLETVLYNRIFRHIGRYSKASKLYSYIRTPFYLKRTDRKIAHIVKSNPDVSFCVLTNYEFYSDGLGVPSILLGDWSYKKLLEREGVIPSVADEVFIKRQEECINEARLVVSLFDLASAHIKKECPAANVIYVGSGHINNLYKGDVTPEFVLPKKDGKKILFIGGPRYSNGAKLVAEALKLLSRRMELHIVGMTQEQLDIDISDVVCHGYLDKGDAVQCKEYYELLMSARLLINPTPVWAGYSSTIEAMYFFTPVVVSPYDEFVNQFGGDIPFGQYVKDNSPESVAEAVNVILNANEEGYAKMCLSAHERVMDCSWDKIVDRLLDKLELN